MKASTPENQQNTWSNSPEGIVSPKVLGLYRFWKQCAGDRSLPFRREVHLEDLPDLLPYIIVLSYNPDTNAVQYVMAGDAVEKALGISLTNLNPERIVYEDPEEAAFWNEVDRAALVEGLPVFGVQWNLSVSGLAYPLEFTTLPMLDDCGRVRTAVGLEDYSQMQADNATLAEKIRIQD